MDSAFNLFSNNEPDKSSDDRIQEIVEVLSAYQMALWTYELATGKCSFADNYFEVLGLKAAGIVFSDIRDFICFVHPDERTVYQNKFEKLLASGGAGLETSRLQVKCVGVHGEIIYLENRFIIKRNISGQSEKLIAYTINITSQYEKEEKIRKLEERSRKIIDVLPEFIFIFNEDFFITDILKAQTIELLHPQRDLIGADARTIYAPEVCELFIRNIKECLKDGQLKEIEYYLDMDDIRHYFQARMVPFEDGKVLALIHDIGDRVQKTKDLIDARRKAEAADRMKSVFLSNMSHEIRTPLNAIVGFSEIIATSDNPEEREEYLGIIRKNSDLLLQLVNDILDISRIESGKSEIHLQPVEMKNWLNEVEKIYRQKIKRGIEYNVCYPEDEIEIYTDRNRLSQIIFNFLSNAVKNTHEGSISLGVNCRTEWIEIFVEDTGCGISEENLSRIFNRFEKLNDFVQGTGLGLAICYTLAERLGGHVEVASELGKGSRFVLCLPCSHGKPEVNTVSQSLFQEKKSVPEDMKRTILVAEDVEANFILANAILKKEYTVIHAVNGEDAVSKFITEKPDLILMDIKMPVMDGFEATRRIREISADIPVIAVTAHAFSTEQEQALRAGCNSVISKPYTSSLLKETIKSYI